jgi:hypothetical protein
MSSSTATESKNKKRKTSKTLLLLLIRQAIGHEKAGCSAVKCFGNLDCAFGLRLWKTHLSKKGAAAKAQPGTYSLEYL